MPSSSTAFGAGITTRSTVLNLPTAGKTSTGSSSTTTAGQFNKSTKRRDTATPTPLGGIGGTSPLSTRTTKGHTTAVAPKATKLHQSQSRPGSGGGLSTGAAIGIGVAIAIFVIALLCGLGFFCWRRHVKRKRALEPVRSTQVSDAGKISDVIQANEKVQGEHEKGAVAMPYELSGKSRAGELETGANRHELEAYHRSQRMHELPGEHSENILLEPSQKASSKD